MNNETAEAIDAWVVNTCGELGVNLQSMDALPGDAGFRRYFRIKSDMPLLAVYAPPATEKNVEFIAIAQAWRDLNIHTPRIYKVDLTSGFMLIEDFGSRSLADDLEQARQEGLQSVTAAYAPALNELFKLQSAAATIELPPYNQTALKVELELLQPWFIQQLLGHTLSDGDQRVIEQAFDWILEQTMHQPQVMVHRDFHCRNIQRFGDAGVGLIDFQDALQGPVTYDLASLLKDCYQKWPASWVDDQALAYRKRLPGHLQMANEVEFLQAFEVMGLQRHIKVLGIFARLHLRDGKSSYLQDLPLVLAYVRATLERYAPLAEFAQWFEAVLMPLVREQDWFCSVEIKP